MGIPIPFGQGFYVSESLPISAQECINMHPRPPQTGTVTKEALFGTPGLEQETQAGADEFNRGGQDFNELPYFINGENLYRIDRTFDAFLNPVYNAVQVGAGTPIQGSQRVITADNGESGGQMCIVAPELDIQFNAWIYDDTAGTLTQVSDADFDGPVSSVDFVDGYFVFAKKNANKWFSSNLRDGLNYTATDFADAEADPDPLRRVFVLNNIPYAFGSITFEPFDNIGGGGFPFQRIDNAVQQKGLSSPFSITEMDGTMVWVGKGENEQAAIWQSSGQKPVKLSTDAIDNQLRQYTDEQISQSFVNRYSEAGSLFVCWTFPDQRTFCYDAYVGLWHTRTSVRNNQIVEWQVSTIVDAYNILLVGSTRSNVFGRLDKEVYTEYGEIMRRRVVLPPIDNNGQPFFEDSFELVMETGNVPINEPEPTILLEISDDGGNSFNYSVPQGLGLTGEYKKRQIWNELGRAARERVHALDMSAAIKWVIFKAEANIE